MCFSMEASFTAATVLGIMGIMNLRACQNKKLFFLAITPFLFATQQASEGFIWYHFTHPETLGNYLHWFVATFLTFAFLVWPVWIPFSLLKAEDVSWKQKVIGLFFVSGLILSGVNLYFALNQDASVQIAGHSIQYLGHAPSQAFIYPAIVIIPCFISSLKNVWQFGILIALTYAFALYMYENTFVSVWCFFGALVSVIIYKIIRDNQTELEKKVS